MISVGQLLALTIWLIAIVLGLAFGGFMHKASKGEVKWNTI
jgi:high-affinity Fe2+/Pb2+ permease